MSVVTLLCLSLGFAASSDGPYWAAALETSHEHSGLAGAILNTGGNLGGLLAPVLTPYIASRAGWSCGLYSGALLLIPGVAMWFFIGSRGSPALERRFEASEPPAKAAASVVE